MPIKIVKRELLSFLFQNQFIGGENIFLTNNLQF